MDAMAVLRSGEVGASFAVVASVRAWMTGLNIAITWHAMAETIAESGWGTGGGKPDKWQAGQYVSKLNTGVAWSDFGQGTVFRRTRPPLVLRMV